MICIAILNNMHAVTSYIYTCAQVYNIAMRNLFTGMCDAKKDGQVTNSKKILRLT